MADALVSYLDALLSASSPSEMLAILCGGAAVPDSQTGMKGFTGEAEFAAGSVLGYRSWKFPVENPMPLTGAFGSFWDSRTVHDSTFTASCKRLGLSRLEGTRHEAPEPSCGCGFWAYWDFPRTPSVNVGGIGWVRVHGILEGFGTVLIGERGFRAGKARIRGLAIDHENYRNELKSEYGMQVKYSSLGIDRSRFKTEQGVALAQEMCRSYRADAGLIEMTGQPQEPPAFPEDAFMAVIAMLEERLEGYYPGARIFSTAASLCKYFGADASYGTSCRRHPELAARGAAWLHDAASRLYLIRSQVHLHCGERSLWAKQATADAEFFKVRDVVMRMKAELEGF